jgi:hypothetical protein
MLLLSLVFTIKPFIPRELEPKHESKEKAEELENPETFSDR